MELNDVLLFQLDKTNKMVKQHSQKEMDMRGMNITVEQWVLLKIIHERSPISQTELAEISLRDPASITRTLDILGKKGLADRENIEGNRRQYNIVLTETGEKFVNKHMGFIEAQRAQSLAGLNEKDQLTFKRLLKKMQENMP